MLTAENDVFASSSDDYFMDFLHESTKHVYSTGCGMCIHVLCYSVVYNFNR